MTSGTIMTNLFIFCTYSPTIPCHLLYKWQEMISGEVGFDMSMDMAVKLSITTDIHYWGIIYVASGVNQIVDILSRYSLMHIVQCREILKDSVI